MTFEMVVKQSSHATESDWYGVCHFYACAVYDDGSEGLPKHQFTTEGSYDYDFGFLTDEADPYYLSLSCFFRPYNDAGEMCFPDSRIVGIKIYYTHSEDDHNIYWELGSVDFRFGWAGSGKRHEVINDSIAEETGGDSANDFATRGVKNWINSQAEEITVSNNSTDFLLLWNNPKVDILTMPKAITFELNNGYDPISISTGLRYKTATIAGRRLFVGNIMAKLSSMYESEVTGTGSIFEKHNDRMVFSPVNQLDILPYPTNVLDLDISDGDQIIALMSTGDRLLQFKENIMYVVNISTGEPKSFFVEHREKFKGIAHRNHVLETDGGIFWFNERGAYLHDGTEIKNLLEVENDDIKQLRIKIKTWSDFVSNDSLCGYDATENSVYVIKNHTHSGAINRQVENTGSAFVYNIITNSWSLSHARFHVGNGNKITNIITKGDGRITYIGEGNENL